MFFKKPTFWLSVLHIVLIGGGAVASVYFPPLAPVIGALATAAAGVAPSPVITRQPPTS